MCVLHCVVCRPRFPHTKRWVTEVKRRWLAFLCLLMPIFAEDRVALSGVVQDSSGGVLVDANIVAMDEETGIRYTARTSREGVYSVSALRPGSYKVTARKPGFRTVARINVPISRDT